jgi:CRISPR/Cas system-associated endoribonuclease Cas2
MKVGDPLYNEIKTEIKGSEKILFDAFIKKIKTIGNIRTEKGKTRNEIIDIINDIFKEFERFPEENEIFKDYIYKKHYLNLRKDYTAYKLYKKFYNTPKRSILNGELNSKKRKVLIERLKEFGFDKNEAISMVRNVNTLEELEDKINLKLF